MKHSNIDRRAFLKSSAVLASVGPFAEAAAGTSGKSSRPEISFPREEYVTRWSRVQAAMTAAGYENVLVWQRSASAYDRLGDVYWLTNFYTNGTGQDPYTEELDEPWTFAAVLLRKGHEPELHIGLGKDAYDASRIVCGKVVTHTPHMTLNFAEYLRAEKIEGRVVVVGDDTLPGKFDRLLRSNTPKIEWFVDDTFLEGPQLIKSPRELEAFRTAGSLVTDALNAALEALISGKKACEAAGRAAAIIIGGGGGFHRISIAHGPALQRPLSYDFYGYDMKAPDPGDLISMWIYGPIFAGYWLDPGRTVVCARRPSSAQKTLIEAGARLVDDMVKAVAPGMTAAQVGIRWADIARDSGYFDAEKDDMFGHGLGTGFPAYVLPAGDTAIGPFGLKRLKGTIEPGMVLAAEAFLTRPGVGVAAFERNFIVTATGVEKLDETPMLFW